MRKRISILLVMVVATAGCATYPLRQWEMERAQQLYSKESYYFDLSKGEKKGTLELHCVPPSEQLLVEHYVISVDNQTPLEVFKHSTVKIILDEGLHTVQVQAKLFGLPSSRKIEVRAGETVLLKYSGPYLIYGIGSLSLLE